jgi:hypothetical protein
LETAKAELLVEMVKALVLVPGLAAEDQVVEMRLLTPAQTKPLNLLVEQKEVLVARLKRLTVMHNTFNKSSWLELCCLVL